MLVDVLDGDTITVEVGGRIDTVRLIGIDTPEVHSGFRDAECFGAEASARLRQLLEPGDELRLELDVETRDRYGRLLAYVHGNGAFVNEQLVAEGYAAAFPFEPNTTLSHRFAAAESRARAHDLGLWGDCGGPDVELDDG